jgi:hypothetical protein
LRLVYEKTGDPGLNPARAWGFYRLCVINLINNGIGRQKMLKNGRYFLNVLTWPFYFGVDPNQQTKNLSQRLLQLLALVIWHQ